MTNIAPIIAGVGIGAATAIATIVGHEKLERDGEWTMGNSRLALGQLGLIAAAGAGAGVLALTGSGTNRSLGAGILLGTVAGNAIGLHAPALFR